MKRVCPSIQGSSINTCRSLMNADYNVSSKGANWTFRHRLGFSLFPLSLCPLSLCPLSLCPLSLCLLSLCPVSLYPVSLCPCS